MYQLLHAFNGVQHLLHETRGREAKAVGLYSATFLHAGTDNA